MNRNGISKALPLATAALLSLVLCMLAPKPAAAGNKEAAKAAFLLGVEAFQNENYPAALKAFEDSYKIEPKRSVLYNIAMCQKALFRYVDALASFEKYISSAPGEIPARKRQKATESVEAMKRLVGTLFVDGAPEGSNILVDGTQTAQTPQKGAVLVDPGDHAVHVMKDGYDTFETRISVSSGEEVRVTAKLEALVAKLIIDCREENAVIKVDGKAVGGCPTVGDVSAGVHEITVSSPSSKQYSKTVEVGPGGEMTVSVALEPASADAAPSEPSEPVAPTATEPAADLEEAAPESSRMPPLLAAGIASLTAGVGFGVVGAVFTIKGSQDVDDGSELWSKMETANSEQDRVAFDTHLSAYNEIRDEDIPRHRAVMIAGYAAGGALAALGATLMVIGRKKREDSKMVSLMPTPLGIAGRF